MFDVLTDEQWDRMLDLIDNPPDYVKKILRKWKEASEKAAEWAPGPNSWQPGDPIPEKYRQERQTKGNFPRPK
jgi:Ni/Co efflux regulator RcnB